MTGGPKSGVQAMGIGSFTDIRTATCGCLRYHYGSIKHGRRPQAEVIVSKISEMDQITYHEVIYVAIENTRLISKSTVPGKPKLVRGFGPPEGPQAFCAVAADLIEHQRKLGVGGGAHEGLADRA